MCKTRYEANYMYMYAGAGFFARFLPHRFMQVFCSPIQLWFCISIFRIKDGAAVGDVLPRAGKI